MLFRSVSQSRYRVNTDDGPDPSANYAILNRGKRHDYFTSCLPWPQKGPGVNLPLGTTGPVYGNSGEAMNLQFGTSTVPAQALGQNNSNGVITANSTGLNSTYFKTNIVAKGGTSTVYADLTSATSATINSLREAFSLQRYAEKSARSGSRYIEILKGHFNVTCPDYRLQRPEFLGGGSQRINITPVIQNSSTDAESPQGNLAGYGVSAGGQHSFTKSFTEHHILLGLKAVS